MAEGIFKAKASDFLDTLTVSSCGIGAFPGDAVSFNAVLALNKMGIDISHHRARQINEYIIDEADKIICLSSNHYNALKSICPNKLILLGDGIQDPYMGDEMVYEECAKKIEMAIDSLLKSDMLFTFDTMKSEDIKYVADIEKSAILDPWSEKSFISQVEKSYSFNIVCKYLGKPIAYLCTDFVIDEFEICTIAVDEKFRQRKIGKKLLTMLIEEANDRNAKLITLEVRASNAPAISLYEKMGFENLGTRKDFYSKPKEDAYIMTKYLNGDKV